MNQAVLKRRAGIPMWAYVAPPAVAALALVGYFVLTSRGGNAGAAYTYHRVQTRNLDVTIKNRGELQAVNNIDIICEVEGSTTIQMVVKEGASVKKGDTLVELDSATIRQRIDDTTLDVQKAEADLVNAREMLEIQKSQNDANLEAAQVALEAAQIDLKKFMDGDYPQKLADARTTLVMARIDLENKESDYKQVQELAAKGFLTPTDVKNREVELVKSRNAVTSAETTLRNLEEFEKKKSLSTFRSALAQSDARLVRTQRENSANIAQKTADLQAKEQTLSLQRRKLEKLKTQFEACTIKAPEDGLVVYSSSGDRNAQNPIQEGAQVRERQNILRLPDTSKMKAVVRIQESQVSRLREGQKAAITIMGLPKPLTGNVSKISVLPDNSQRWWNPDLKEYPVDIELDETPEGLKPGVFADTEIAIARKENVVTVPVSTIYSSGSKAYVFLRPVSGRADAVPVPKEITLGLSNETDVEVKDGLVEGTEVLVLQAGQGRELLLKAGIADEPASRPAFAGRRGNRNGNKDGAAAPAGPPTAAPNAAPNGAPNGAPNTPPGAAPAPDAPRIPGPQSAAPATRPAVTGVEVK